MGRAHLVLRRSEKPKPVVVYCAAALKAPLEEIAKEYEKECGVEIQLQFGASQNLLTPAEVAGRGDLYLPADETYLRIARDKDLLAEVLPLARMTGVIAVKKGNPLGIKSLDDLLNGKAKVVQANPDVSAVGRLTRELLMQNGSWEKLKGHTTAFAGTVNEAANAVVVGSADAAIVWNVTVLQYPDLEAVTVPRLTAKPVNVSLGVLKTSDQPTAALRFARYVAARDRGLKTLKTMGYDPLDGDAWAEKPKLLLYAGAMLRPAIEKTVAEFQDREGVEVTTVYNGCGILIAQMNTKGDSPDAYFACDTSFMEQVRDKFEKPIEVSGNQLVILVPKANPHGIKTLKDLARVTEPPLRVGIGHEKQCALGVLTQETLEAGEIARADHEERCDAGADRRHAGERVAPGSLDAVVAYISNAAEAGDALTAYKVDVKCAMATQPVAVGKTSDHKYLTQRLLDALQTSESEQRFKQLGFSWKVTK